MVGPSLSSGRPAGPGRTSGGEASSGVGRFTNLCVLDQVDSTNSYALARAAAGEGEGLVVVADEQLAGRGRLGRSWRAPRGSALLCSVLLRPGEGLGAGEGFLAMTCMALAAREAAGALAGVACGLKWPNDLLVGGRKLAGLLAERGEGDVLVVGIGCNLRTPADPGLPAGATSLEAASGGRLVTREAFLEALLVGFERRYGTLVAGPGGAAPSDGAAARRALLEEARAASATLGESVRVELPGGSVVRGTAVAILDDGRLVVERDGPARGHRLVVGAGDVVHLRGLEREGEA